MPLVIAPQISGASERERIITPYDATAFESTLRAHGLLGKYPDLPSRLRYGFPIGDMPRILQTSTPKNHASDPNHLTFIMDYAAEQVALGRMSGPYTRSEVESILKSPFVTSPLSVVDKAGAPGKYRLVQNCSYRNELGVSVNMWIDPDDFPTEWGTAAEFAEIVATCAPGSQACSLDVDSAFRNIPIHPNHKPWLVIQVENGSFYIDHVCPFGIASGCGLQGCIMDAIVDILAARGIHLTKKWVDDLSNVREPTGIDANGAWIYSHGVQDIFDVTAPLGVPWKAAKCFDYAFSVIYLGFLWDLPARTVSLPEEKRVRYLAKVEALLAVIDAGKQVTYSDAMSVNGTLSHIAFVYPQGRAYLTSLSAFTAKFPSRLALRWPPHSLVSDLRWWLDTLRAPGVYRSLTPRGELRDLGISVDASTSWGVGVVIGGKVDAWKLRSGWKSERRDIGWAEMVAVELAVRHVEGMGLRDCDILVLSDNMGVVGAFTRGRSRNYQVNASIRRAAVIAMSLNIRFVVNYVSTDANVADPVSRGKSDPSAARLPLIALPEELLPFLDHA